MPLQASFLMAAEYSFEVMKQETFKILYLQNCNSKGREVIIFI